EHTELLGDTRRAIAREKLAVVPEGGVVVMGEPGWEDDVPQAAAVRVVAQHGTFQDQNRAVAVAAVEALLDRPVDPSPIEHLAVAGRLEGEGGTPLEIWDCAHTPSGRQRRVAELPPLLGGRTAVAVFGAQRDKDVGTMIALL